MQCRLANYSPNVLRIHRFSGVNSKPSNNKPINDPANEPEIEKGQGTASDAEMATPAVEPKPGDGRRAFRMTVAYDGSNYFGWQLQPDLPTVQEAVERALSQLFDVPKIRVIASSRTDTGVHALGQSVVVRTDRWTAPADRLPYALNTCLPADIVVREACEVPIDFYPLRASTGKRYEYFVYCSRKADPIHGRTHWWVRRSVCDQAMRDAAQYLVGEHDFASFQTTGSPRESTVRHVRKLEVEARPHMDGVMLKIHIEANGFLYNMVRNIVGTLIQVGVGREKPEWVVEVLAAKDRRAAGATAPPQGLFLTEVLF